MAGLKVKDETLLSMNDLGANHGIRVATQDGDPNGMFRVMGDDLKGYFMAAQYYDVLGLQEPMLLNVLSLNLDQAQLWVTTDAANFFPAINGQPVRINTGTTNTLPSGVGHILTDATFIGGVYGYNNRAKAWLTASSKYVTCEYDAGAGTVVLDVVGDMTKAIYDPDGIETQVAAKFKLGTDDNGVNIGGGTQEGDVQMKRSGITKFKATEDEVTITDNEGDGDLMIQMTTADKSLNIFSAKTTVNGQDAFTGTITTLGGDVNVVNGLIVQ